MFKPTQNIDTAFQMIRWFMLVVVIGSILVSGYAIYTNSVLTTRAQDKVYVLSNGQAVEVFASSKKRKYCGGSQRSCVPLSSTFLFS